ncbi:MAG TPA: inverse autotransporter beta domain-containing protein [Rhizomicrobium sp.]
MTPIDPPKWLPYVDIGGGVGSGFAIGRATAFVPFWQDLDSLAFVRFGADTGHRNTDNDFNLGFGYRTKIDSEWILGAFAGFDSSQTEFNHTFNQFSFGIEAMSADWDIRANAYIAKKDNRAIGDKFQLYIHDTTIAILQGQEAALSGFDGEVGYRVFNTDSTDVRVFAGAYTFHHAAVDTAGVGTNFNFPYHDLTGPKLRAEVNVFDLDMLGPQSRLSIEGQVSHDNVHHTSEYIGATLRIALGDISGAGAQTLDDLDRRMADPVRRNDNVLTQWQFNKPEPVIIYNSTVTSKPTNTLYYAEQKSGAGVGSYADQTTIQDATTRGGAGKNAFIVLTDAGGSTIDATGTTVRSGETLTGAGTFKVRGANSTFPVFTHDFAPGSGPVSLGTTSGNVLNLSGDANIANLSIVGPFVDGIYGANVGNVNISNVTIDGGGAGTNGMVFKQTDTSGTSNITIANSSIKGVTNDGVDLSVSQTGGTSTTNLSFSNGAITAGNHGVNVASTATGSSNATVYAGIHDSTLTTGGVGAEMTGATGGSATLTQTLLVDPTTIHAGGDYGIYIHANITAGTLTQNAVIDDVKLTGTTHGGLAVLGGAKGGHLYQNIEVSNLSITNTEVPVGIVAYGAHGGKVDQTVAINGLTANNATYDGITLGTFAYSGAIVHQTATLNDIQVSNAGYSGLHAQEIVNGGATGIQTVSVTNLTANNEGLNGVYGYVYSYGAASGAPSVAAQYISVDHASLNDNGRYGVLANAYAVGNAVTRQDITVEHATINGNAAGIVVNGYAYDGASAQQNIYFAYDVIQHNAADGVDLHVLAAGDNGFAAQYGTIYEVDASYNGQDGFNIGALAVAADAEQQFYMVDVTGDHEGRTGLQIGSYAVGYTAGSYTNYPAHVQQNVYAIYGSFSNNARDGVEVYNYAAAGAAIDQTVFLYGLDISHNTGFGVYEQSYATGTSPAMPTHLYADLQVLNSVVDYNGYGGIYQYSHSNGATNQRSHTTVSGSDVSYNTGDGFTNIAVSENYYATNLQYVTLSGSLFDGNTHNGAYFSAYDVYGPGPYGFAGHIVTISNSDFSYNGHDGLRAYAESTGENGRAEQYFTIEYSNFSHNGRNGFDDFNYAHDGQYNTGYACFQVQGTAGGCAIVRASTTVIGSTFEDNAYSGIYIGSNAENYGTIYSQSGHGGAPSLYVAGSTITGNGYAGIAMPGAAEKYSSLIQTIVVDSTNISHNGTDGTFFTGGPSGSLPQGGLVVLGVSKYQSFNLENVYVQNGSSISDNKGIGIVLGGQAFVNYIQYDALSVLDSTVSRNYGGAVLENFSLYSFYTGQSFTSSGSTFADNTLGSGAFSPKYQGAGVATVMFAVHNKYIQQSVSSAESTFSGNDGIGLGAYFGGGGNYQTYQNFSSTHDNFAGNGDGGLAVNLNVKYGNTPATSYNAHQTVYLAGSTFDALSGTDGARISAYSDNAITTQLIYIYNDAAGHANAFTGGDTGLNIYGVTGDDGTLATTLLVQDATFASSGAGIQFTQIGDTYNPTAQVGIYGNTFTGHTADGIFVLGRDATETFAIQGNTFVNQAGTYGIYMISQNTTTQDINVHTNNQSGAGTPYYFNDAGFSQTITY